MMSGTYEKLDKTDRDARAVEVLRSYFDNHWLRIPPPYVNELGQHIVSWDEDNDGDVMACYLDILGLNDRPIVENTSATMMEAKAARRKFNKTKQFEDED